MGCGTSKAVQAIEEDLSSVKDPPSAHLEVPDELTSVRSNTPDVTSKPVDPPSGQLIQSNGTEPSAPPQEDGLPEAPLREHTPPTSGNRAVAFEVGPADTNESLIRRHPPRKFQKLEDQIQNNLTQEKLEEKQAIAEKRRQEILSQRVQSAKHRSAGRMRSRPADGDEVEQLDDGEIETAATINAENEL